MQTVQLQPTTIHAIAHVGAVVTHAGHQWTVHSVEGPDFYAFVEKDGTITVDADMEPADVDTRAYLIPMNTQVGTGFGLEVKLTHVRRGVCLDKSYR